MAWQWRVCFGLRLFSIYFCRFPSRLLKWNWFLKSIFVTVQRQWHIGQMQVIADLLNKLVFKTFHHCCRYTAPWTRTTNTPNGPGHARQPSCAHVRVVNSKYISGLIVLWDCPTSLLSHVNHFPLWHTPDMSVPSTVLPALCSFCHLKFNIQSTINVNPLISTLRELRVVTRHWPRN